MGGLYGYRILGAWYHFNCCWSVHFFCWLARDDHCNLGIILGVVARKKMDDNYKLATAGMVCSIVGLVLSLILYIACVACVSALAASVPMY